MSKYKFINNKYKKAGLPPGTLVHIGSHKPEKVKIGLISYSQQKFHQESISSIEELISYKHDKSISWIDVEGVNDIELIESIGKHFGHHRLILEDILNTEKRPEISFFQDYIFIALKMISYNDKKNIVETEHVSFILGKDYLISLQEGIEGDVFEPIRKIIKNEHSLIRQYGADFLAYSLIDIIIDNYFIVLEKISEKMEDLDDILINNPTPDTLQQIYALKREILFLRKAIWPLREILSKFERTDSEVISSNTKMYIRDIYEHIIQIIDTEETFRDIISGMMDLYLSSVSNKMNEVMKVLSIIGTIFIPLTFIAGVYGMNFEYMPELKMHYAYPITLFIMLLLGVGMLIAFRIRKWI